MFNLLSKQANGPIKNGLTAKDIHSDFIAEANVLSDDSNKACQLAKLGFTNAKNALKINKFHLMESEYFKQHYPLNKYLTYEQIQNLCSKYGLVFGRAEQYIGDIPDKNLKEISNFKVRKEDVERIAFDMLYQQTKEFGLIEFFICAPLKDMKLRHNERVDSRGFVVQDDPIVIKPAYYGGLIISMWGDEASDSQVINEINN